MTTTFQTVKKYKACVICGKDTGGIVRVCKECGPEYVRRLEKKQHREDPRKGIPCSVCGKAVKEADPRAVEARCWKCVQKANYKLREKRKKRVINWDRYMS